MIQPSAYLAPNTQHYLKQARTKSLNATARARKEMSDYFFLFALVLHLAKIKKNLV